MTLYVGTSGYSHAEWKGNFYPAKLSQKKMLEYYARQFPTVEVNYTFRQLPTEKVIDNWAAQAPASFRFVLNGPQSITHFKRLQNTEQEIDDFLRISSRLGEQLGPILLQLPPNFKKNVPRLAAFLKQLAGRAKVAFEFRNASWLDEEVADCLRSYEAAICVTDRDDLPAMNVLSTAEWGYFRLWNDNYSDECLRNWSDRIRSQAWTETYLFFMHEDAGISPELAKRFQQLSGEP